MNISDVCNRSAHLAYHNTIAIIEYVGNMIITIIIIILIINMIFIITIIIMIIQYRGD